MKATTFIITFARYIGWTVFLGLVMFVVVWGILAWIFDLHD